MTNVGCIFCRVTVFFSLLAGDRVVRTKRSCEAESASDDTRTSVALAICNPRFGGVEIMSKMRKSENSGQILKGDDGGAGRAQPAKTKGNPE